MKNIATIAALALAAALAVAPAHAKERKPPKDYGTTPQNCYYGPRGGLHCPRVVRGPSDESAAQRERRMKRECKGRPNAGACLGYGG